VGTARVATRAIETIVSTVIRLPDRLPLVKFAQSFEAGRERACHSGGFHIHSGRATPIILAVADRFGIPAVAGMGMGLDEEKLAFEEPRPSLPERQRTAFAIMIEGLGGDHAIDEYNAGGPADLIGAHCNHALEQRHAAGRTPWFARSFLRAADGRTTTMSRRNGVRFSTPWKPS
jgi:hypothetical protein